MRLRLKTIHPTWVEQRAAVRIVAARAEKQLASRNGDLEELLEERANIENFYHGKYEDLTRCLHSEAKKAEKQVAAKKKELEDSLRQEHETTQELILQERKNDESRATLEQTVSQLGQIRHDMEAAQEEYGLVERRNTATPATSSTAVPDSIGGVVTTKPQAPPDLMHARARLEGHLQEKEQTFAERNAAMAEVLRVQDELEVQRAHASKLEDFVRRLIHSGNSSNGYMLDPAAKKEAAAILAATAKLQAARQQAAALSGDPTSQQGASFIGRRCAGYDEYDVRWPPPSVDPSHLAAVP